MFSEPRRFFFDGYGIDNDILSDISLINKFIQEVKSSLGCNTAKVLTIPYFNGKVKSEGGISAVIVGNGFHLTCRTFCYKNIVFIDCLGGIDCEKKLLPIILKYFPTSDFDLCNNNDERRGNFGKHVIIKCNKAFDYTCSRALVKKILKISSMTPISKIIINRESKKRFDILQPIAESYISIHILNNISIIDVFSCKNFDEKDIVSLFENFIEDIKIILRGLKYK